MKHTIISVIVLASITWSASGRELNNKQINYQVQTHDSLMIWDKLNIQSSPQIKELLERHVRQNKKYNFTNGYRLQIYFGAGSNARSQATKVRTDFLSMHPDIKVYLIFKSPDFKVLVGNFRTKSEALKLQKSLIFQFPNAFIVADEIALPELAGNTSTK
jgi:hypothetical protein